MKFGMHKCKVLTMQQGRMKHWDGLKLLDGELMKETDTAGYKYLGKLHDGQIDTDNWKKSWKRNILEKSKNRPNQSYTKKNMIDKINTWVVGVT